MADIPPILHMIGVINTWYHLAFDGWSLWEINSITNAWHMKSVFPSSAYKPLTKIFFIGEIQPLFTMDIFWYGH